VAASGQHRPRSREPAAWLHLVQTSSHDKTTGSEQQGHFALLRPWLLHRQAKQE
jgi:hypothetical protein